MPLPALDTPAWRRAAARYGPPLLWMAVISGLSTDAFSSDSTGGYVLPILRWLFPGTSAEVLALVHTAIRKAMHVLEYAVLALLWVRALRAPGRPWSVGPALIAWALASVFAAGDEYHQSFLATRAGTPLDVAWDALGATLGLGLSRVAARMARRASRPPPSGSAATGRGK